MPTISDVAARAGVSTATVSRALNGKATVDPELAARVRQAATELGYQPNGPARNLRRQEAAVVALIISDVENPFFTAIARGVEDVAHEVGYSVVLCNSDENAEKENRYIDIAIQERVAGVISLNGAMPRHGGPLFRLPEVRQLRAFIGHGIANALVPLASARRDFLLLYTAGLAVRMNTYPTTHRLHPDMLRDVNRWVIDRCNEG